jgi:hypothetical protein
MNDAEFEISKSSEMELSRRRKTMVTSTNEEGIVDHSTSPPHRCTIEHYPYSACGC